MYLNLWGHSCTQLPLKASPAPYLQATFFPLSSLYMQHYFPTGNGCYEKASSGLSEGWRPSDSISPVFFSTQKGAEQLFSHVDCFSCNKFSTSVHSDKCITSNFPGKCCDENSMYTRSCVATEVGT